MVLAAGAGNGDIARLQVPAKNDLRGGLAVGSGNGGDGFIVEKRLCVAPPAQGGTNSP